MGFSRVLAEYAKHVQKLISRTPGPVLKPSRAKAKAQYEEAMSRICCIGHDPDTNEGFVMRTDAQLESGKGWAKK